MFVRRGKLIRGLRLFIFADLTKPWQRAIRPALLRLALLSHLFCDPLSPFQFSVLSCCSCCQRALRNQQLPPAPLHFNVALLIRATKLYSPRFPRARVSFRLPPFLGLYSSVRKMYGGKKGAPKINRQ